MMGNQGLFMFSEVGSVKKREVGTYKLDVGLQSQLEATCIHCRTTCKPQPKGGAIRACLSFLQGRAILWLPRGVAVRPDPRNTFSITEWGVATMRDLEDERE